MSPSPKSDLVGLVIGGLLVVGAINSAMSGDHDSQTSSATSTEAAEPKAKPKSGVSQGLGTKDASSDVKVVAFTAGEYSSEVELEITNHSEGRSDYYVEITLLDKSGTNVGWTNAIAQAVEPGQKAKVTAPVVEDGAVKAKVHEVQRTASS